MDLRFIRFLSLVVFLIAKCSSKESDAFKPLIFTVASEKTDGYNRFIRSAEHYGLSINTLGMDEAWKGGDMNFQGGGYKINLLKEALKPYIEAGDDNFIVMFTDSYDVIFLSEWETILEKFKESKSKILFGAENFCWPNEQLKLKYPSVEGAGQKYLNSGMYIGYLRNIWNIVNYQPIRNEDDDQLFFTEAYLDDDFRQQNSFKLDHKSNLFQNLNGNIDDVAVSFDSEGYSKLLNKKYVKNPAILHGNGPSKLALNNFGNYLAGAYHNGECISCEENLIPVEQQKSFTIFIAVFIEQATPFMEEFWGENFRFELSQESNSSLGS